LSKLLYLMTTLIILDVPNIYLSDAMINQSYMLIINDLPRMSCWKLIYYFFYVCTCIIIINYKLYCGFLREIKIRYFKAWCMRKLWKIKLFI